MKKLACAAGCLVWVAVCAAIAIAGPQNGFGAYAGPVFHEYASRFVSGVVTHYESGGLNVAGDMQFVIDEKWSLNPSLELSAESVSGDITGSASNGVAAFQVRRWFGADFIGLQIGEYVTLLSTGSQSGTKYGAGFGFAAGHEREDGWSYGALVDFPVFTDISTAIRLHVGYRFR
jgi:hypothetical protein